MKIVIPGGTGQVGQLVALQLGDEHDAVILSRSPANVPGATRVVEWDGKRLGAWASEIDGADVVLNLAGKTVNCRYTQANLDEMLRSRTDSTRVVGQAIERAQRSPALWLQMSTATIYSHRFDADQDEATGILGGSEPEVPRYWDFSIKIATEWEQTQADAPTPNTRKVALRTAMVMTPSRGGIFDMLRTMTRLGLGGPIAGGKQFVSWIHGTDFVRALLWIMDHPEIDGVINLASPGPLPQREFMKLLRRAIRVPIGLPAAAWMIEIGAFFLRTDTELLLKSRRVVPGRLRELGFRFEFPEWEAAACDLVTAR